MRIFGTCKGWRLWKFTIQYVMTAAEQAAKMSGFAGHVLPIVGNDDVHTADGEDIGKCWTWLKMPSLSVSNVLKAIRTGACYVSCGPKISDFRIKGGKVCLRCSAASKIHFIGGPGGMGIRHRAEDGKSIKSFSIDVPYWPYVRAVVANAAGQRAWTNPIVLERNVNK